MNIKINSICFLFLLPVFMLGQSDTSKVISILNESQKVYDLQGDYSLNATYTLYKGADSDQIETSYDALLIKQGENFYSRIHNTELLYFAKAYLKVNHDQKRFQYNILDKEQLPEKGISIGSYLKFFKEHTLKETADSYICTLTSTIVTPLPFGKMIMHIDKETMQVTKQVFFYIGEVAFEEGLNSTRLEVEFSPMQNDITDHQQKLELSTYVQVKNNKAKGIGSLATYELITL